MSTRVCALVALLSLPALARADEAEDKAVATVTRLKGFITRDETAKDHPVIEVDLAGSRVTDGDLKDLLGFRKLRTLSLGYTKVGDAGLQHVARMKQLRVLSLAYTRVTDLSLKHLVDLTALRQLELDGTRMSEESVRLLRDVLPDCVIQHEE